MNFSYIMNYIDFYSKDRILNEKLFKAYMKIQDFLLEKYQIDEREFFLKEAFGAFNDFENYLYKIQSLQEAKVLNLNLEKFLDYLLFSINQYQDFYYKESFLNSADFKEELKYINFNLFKELLIKSMKEGWINEITFFNEIFKARKLIRKLKKEAQNFIKDIVSKKSKKDKQRNLKQIQTRLNYFKNFIKED